jgi:hypothetical protein
MNTTTKRQAAALVIGVAALCLLIGIPLNNIHQHPNPPRVRAWISPTGYSDPDSGWDSETYAFDDNENSSATTV